ncbi:magnesium transporter NIPA-domain-containing protein [Calycina marina]|uniref:Magnesium transporter NIPA-domain-containing protein n=1 Tax=Calycina marina TaxID=1763456 RepID=A0A9P7Z4S7_9HELO|nr:magnesium transporter NIPA-domain-containing protein [Calycina marina]
MDQIGHTLATANLIYARANTTAESSDPLTETRPSIYKAIGISLAVASGVFIGVSFVLKKVGLLKANVKYEEVAGEGYGYLKNAFWWGGMSLMIIGEICNFVAYAFVDAILVTPMGALSVVITAILSAIFLKERLSMVGKVGCFLCIVGSVVIVMNAPEESSVATIQEMQHYVIAPGFLSYAGVLILGCLFLGFWVGPRYGKKSMLVYLSICSLIGGLSVVATQGLGSAIIAQIGGTKQYNQWFLYVLFVFVVATLLTEIIYLNKALNLFNASLVTPTYYVFFTTATLMTSAILFQGFKGSVTSIVNVVMGFLVICAGVILLQLSKSAKDVPDAAVFSGDLDQVRTIAEQEQPESEPKADAIRGAAAIVRRFSTIRQQNEVKEAKRLYDEKQLDLLPIAEDEQIEWDGLRRRRTTIGSRNVRSREGAPRSRENNMNIPFPAYSETPNLPHTPHFHPPLGMSHFPDDDEETNEDEHERRATSVSLFQRAKSIIGPNRASTMGTPGDVRSPMYPVPLTEISIPAYKSHGGDGTPGYYGHEPSHFPPFSQEPTEYRSITNDDGRHITILDDADGAGSRSSLHPSHATAGPTPPPHSARRQFSFQNVFRKGQSQSFEEPISQSRSPIVRKGLGLRKTSGGGAKGATEEERLGLVKGDTRTDDKLRAPSSEDSPPPPLPKRTQTKDFERESSEEAYYAEQRRKWEAQGGNASSSSSTSPPPNRGRDRNDSGDASGGAFI